MIRTALTLLSIVGAANGALGQDCSVLGQNTFVRDVMDDYYLWYRDMPSASPANFDSPEALLDALRVRPQDTSFSYISGAAATTAFYSNSQFIGIGFTQKLIGIDELRVAQVFPESPASEAGMQRGDVLLAVGGTSVSELLANGGLGAALGPATEGLQVELTWRRLSGEIRTETVTKRPVTIPTVSQTEVLDVDGLPVGYIHFRNFVEPSVEALNRAFEKLQAQGVTDLVLDLRYNGGGLVSVAQQLASLIGGTRTTQKVFVDFRHNDKRSDLDQAFRFQDRMLALSLPRVVVLTSRASASASELVINGLEPFVDVTVVGRRTFGKPVGQYGFNFCEKVLFPVSFQSVNANGVGDFFDGIPVDCPMRDGITRPLGDPEEDMLEEALFFLRNQRCSPESEQERAAQSQRASPTPVARPYGFDQLVNAR